MVGAVYDLFGVRIKAGPAKGNLQSHSPTSTGFSLKPAEPMTSAETFYYKKGKLREFRKQN